MKFFLISLCSLFPLTVSAQEFTCPAGRVDIMKYFVMDRERRANHFLEGKPNPI